MILFNSNLNVNFVNCFCLALVFFVKVSETSSLKDAISCAKFRLIKREIDDKQNFYLSHYKVTLLPSLSNRTLKINQMDSN